MNASNLMNITFLILNINRLCEKLENTLEIDMITHYKLLVDEKAKGDRDEGGEDTKLKIKNG